MKAEPVGAAIAIAAIAATTANPIMYALAGSLAGAAVGASITDGTLWSRAVRLICSLLTGFIGATALHSAGAIYALMYAPAAMLAVKHPPSVDLAVGYAISAFAFIFATLAWPALLAVERRAPAFFRRLGGRFDDPSSSPYLERPTVRTSRGRVAKAANESHEEGAQ